MIRRCCCSNRCARMLWTFRGTPRSNLWVQRRWSTLKARPRLTWAAAGISPEASWISLARQARAATNEIKVLGSGTLNLIGTIYAAKGQLEVSGNGLVNGGGDSVHFVGSQFIGSTMEVSGNGKVCLDARPFNSLSLTATVSP